MHRTPQDLRSMATKCRQLAADCITEAAREPLADMAEALDEAADHERAPSNTEDHLASCADHTAKLPN